MHPITWKMDFENKGKINRLPDKNSNYAKFMIANPEP
jgi:hypothetical protein